jgi:hypothetical protein
MDALFLDQEHLEKTATFYVDSDHTTWVKTIITRLLSEYPSLSNFELAVEWKNNDFKQGYAVGVINVQNVAAIPIIIKDRAVSDMDVIIANGLTLPLNDTTLVAIFNNPEAFKETKIDSSRVFDQFLFNKDLDQPESDYSSVKYASVLEKVSSTVLEEDKKVLLDTMLDSMQEFITSDNVEFIQKVADIKSIDVNDFAENLMRGLDMDRQYVYNDEQGNSVVKQASSRVNYTYRLDVTKPEADSCQLKANSGELEKTASYERSNSYSVGERTLFLTKEGSYTIFDNNEIPASVHNFEEMHTEPSIGDTGVYVVGNTSTVPFEVLGIQKIAGVGQSQVAGFDGLKRVSYYPLNIERCEFVEHDMYKDAYFVPKNAKFVKLAEKITPHQYENLKNDVFEHHITRDSAGMYSLIGKEFDKYAECNSELSYDDAMWRCVHCNVYDSELDKIAELKSGQMTKLAHVRSPLSLEKLESMITDEYNGKFVTIKDEAVKIAADVASFADKQSVDAVLALGLMNKDNISEYIAHIPLYERVMTQLAKLLLSIRVGMSSVKESNVQNAMHALSKVVVQLRGLHTITKESK